MQAIIMAAGRGSRLGSMTEAQPKCLLEIHGKKLLDINLAILHKYGIWDITIVTGYQDEKLTEATRKVPGIHLVYNPFYELTNVIGSYYMGMERLHDDFVYLHADTICDIAIFDELLRAEGDVILPVDRKFCDEEAMKVRIEKDKIVEITKQMSAEEADGEFIGICKIKQNVIHDLNAATVDVLRDKHFSAYFEGALQKVIDRKKYDFKIIDTDGRFWGEIDFPEDYEKAARNISPELLEF